MLFQGIQITLNLPATSALSFKKTFELRALFRSNFWDYFKEILFFFLVNNAFDSVNNELFEKFGKSEKYWIVNNTASQESF